MFNQGGISSRSTWAHSQPDLADLHSLLSKALAGRSSVKTSWRSADRLCEYVLTAQPNTSGGDPKWQLFVEHLGTQELLFDYASCDVLLVHNFIRSACAEFQGNILAQSKAHKSLITPDTPPPMMATAMPKAEMPGHHGAADVPLSGDLAKSPLDQLLHDLASAKMTGKLELRNNQSTALLFVKDGLPVDAVASDTEGDNALIELLAWRAGQFVFEPRVLRNSHTVHQPIESLVAQSKQFSDRIEYLTKAGLHHTSTLLPKEANLSDSDFIAKTASGAPLSPEAMLHFYRELNGTLTIDELSHSVQISRVQFIHLVYHLVAKDVVKVSTHTNPIILAKKPPIQARSIESAAIQGVMMSLRRLETGMFIYPAFLYFLEQEYFRCHRSKTPLSVIVFDMSSNSGDSAANDLSSAAVLDAVLRISQLKRHVDLLAHYDSSDYALLLPNTKANGAQIFAKRIVKALTETPLAGEFDSAHLSLALGCASMPEDATELGELLGAADMAMAHSRESKKGVVMYRDIKPISL